MPRWKPASIVILVVLAPFVARGQSLGNAGTLNVSVTDPTGASVPGATVALRNKLTGYSQTVKSDSDGKARVANVPPNQYHLEVDAPGFASFAQDVTMRTSVPLSVEAKLALASATSSVTVEAAGADILEQTPFAHDDVDQTLIQKLPSTTPATGLSDLITKSSAGVVADSNGFFHPLGDHAQTSYVVDGQPINDQQSKSFSTQLPPNAFQSLELVTGTPNAEYGDKTSLVVSAVTRSGLGHKLSGSLDMFYGSFGTVGENATLGGGSSKLGNYLVVDTLRSGRFLDAPEFTPFHDKGTNATIFDHLDWQPTSADSAHLDIFGARNWFQIPNTYDQLGQDQKQRVTTFSVAPGYQHIFSPTTLLTANLFFRQDRVTYYASRDPLSDTPVTLGQNRHLTNGGLRLDLAYANGVHNVKLGTQIMDTRLKENFQLGVTDPAFNPVCLAAGGAAVVDPSLIDPALCSSLGFAVNPDLNPGLLPYDLSRRGSPFRFSGAADVVQQAVYAQDQITFHNLTVGLGLRWDHYDGISTDNLLQPRTSVSYLVRPTQTVLRFGFSRTLETPYNENLVLSSVTGQGGLAQNVFGGFGAAPLRPGHRTQYNAGFQQAVTKYLRVEGDYFWKNTKNAYDFDTLLNTPIAFPISWRKSKLDGISGRISTVNLHGFQAYVTLGHNRARFFGPEIGGLLFNSPLRTSVFRIDHDQVFQQTTNLRYQHGPDGVWVGFTWRYDSGAVAGRVATVDDAVGLTAAQQVAIGFSCAGTRATYTNPITSCAGRPYSATRIRIPSPGRENDDTNPPRLAPRHLFDVAFGTDNLFHKEHLKTSLRLTIANLSNEASLYNFLSTFSGTHWVEPRALQASLGWAF